jgi:hypothetical protein
VDLLNAGMRDSGVYYLQIRGTTYWFLKVFCEQEVADGGWTVSRPFCFSSTCRICTARIISLDEEYPPQELTDASARSERF